MIAPFTQPDFTADSAAQYKANIDGAVAAMAPLAAALQVHAQAAPDMTVYVRAGLIDRGDGTLVAAGDVSTGTITAPSADPRIDRVVVDLATGAVVVVTGAEDAAPEPPAIPAGHAPLAQIALATSTTEIANSLITDERALLVNTQDLALRTYRELDAEIESAGSAETLDLAAGTFFHLTLDAASCAIDFDNYPPAGRVASWSVVLRQDGTGGRLATWAAEVVWAGGVPPDLTADVDAEDVFTFFTRDGGVTVYGFVSGQDMK